MRRTRTIVAINTLLIAAILVMINLLSSNAYRRWDLTNNNAYSLSRVSRETLAQIEDPLRVRVFYNSEVPAPYNGVRQYMLDLLREFDTVEGRYFSYEIVDPTTEQGRQAARQYGLQQVEIQEIRSDEFQSRSVYMGAAVLYGNVVERVDRLTSTDGLEYELTTAMRSAITQVDALSGAGTAVTMRVFASPSLSDLQIEGFGELETQMLAIHERINQDNYGRIEFEFVQPSAEAEIDRISEEFGVQPVRWETRAGAQREGLLEIVLTLNDRVERVPIQIFSGLFGGYSLADPADIEESVRQGLRSLVAANPRIAYSLTAGEKAPGDFQRGAGPFARLIGERYELVNVNLNDEAIPAGVDQLILNGPTEQYSQRALYRIDQFVMNGGSLFVLLDRHVQNIPTQQERLAGVQPSWDYNETGLEPMIEDWGVLVSDRMVLDEQSFVSRGRQGGQQQIFQAPVVSGEGINREIVITSGLEDVIVLNATELLPSVEEDSAAGDIEYTPLLRTSPAGWTVPSPSEIGPWISGAPEPADTARRDVAALLRGSFASTFDEPVDLGLPELPEDASADEQEPAGEESAAAAPPATSLRTDRYRALAAEAAHIVVVSSSALTTPQMIDAQSRTPNSTFLMNAVDYLNGAPGVAELRSKGLGVPRLEQVNPSARAAARWGNTVGLPLVVLAVGGIVWARRRRRARRVRALFEPTSEVAP